MAVILEGGCRVSDMREGEVVVEGTLRIWKQIGRESGAQAISLRVMEFAPGLSPGIRNEECDEILYVLPWERRHPARIEVNTTRDNACVNLLVEGRSHDVDPDTGIYIRPDATFAL